MAGYIQPLAQQFPIVNSDGTPTEYFTRWAQQRQIDISGGVTLDMLNQWASERNIIAGTGLSGGGTLDSDVTLNLDATLGQLNDVDLTSAPPTDGQVLAYDQTSGLWVPANQSGGGGGGGGGYALIQDITVTTAGDTFPVFDVSEYSSVRILIQGRSTVAANTVGTYLRFNGDTSGSYYWQYNYNYGTAGSGQQVNDDTHILLAEVPGANYTAIQSGQIIVDITGMRSSNLWTSVRSLGTFYKTHLAQNFQTSVGGFWNKSDPVNTIEIEGTWAVGTRIQVLGVKTGGGGGGGSGVVPTLKLTDVVGFPSAGAFTYTFPPGLVPGDFMVIIYGGGFGDAVFPPGWERYIVNSPSNWGGSVASRYLTAEDIALGTVLIDPSGTYAGTVSCAVFSGKGSIRTPLATRAPGTGASTSSFQTDYSPRAGDVALLFASNRANSVNTFNLGTLAGQINQTDRSAALSVYYPSVDGNINAVFNYSTPGAGRYEGIVVVTAPID